MKWYRLLLDILFPAICASCELNRIDEPASQLLCKTCTLHPLPATALCCPVCRGRIPLSRLPHLPLKMKLCHPKANYTLLAATDYSNPVIRTLIRKLKFSRHSKIATYLGAYVATSAQPLSNSIDLIVPIPLSTARYRERGFNQAELITTEIAAHLAKPFETSLLLRIKNTVAQSTIRGIRARQENLEGSFLVQGAEKIHGKRILLVDDVWTTGATMNTAAAELKKAGAKRVIGLVIARAH